MCLTGLDKRDNVNAGRTAVGEEKHHADGPAELRACIHYNERSEFYSPKEETKIMNKTIAGVRFVKPYKLYPLREFRASEKIGFCPQVIRAFF